MGWQRLCLASFMCSGHFVHVYANFPAKQPLQHCPQAAVTQAQALSAPHINLLNSACGRQQGFSVNSACLWGPSTDASLLLQVSKDGSSTNVTGRLALATTPQAVLRTYEAIAYGFTTQNLAQYFQGLLAQAGMNVTVQLMSLSGVPLAAAPTQADLVSAG